ncbi:asparagine synthase-related protein [Planktomarina temperata]|nr:asparagine synthase-related protein [bacterium]MDB2458915.1 asparagine synthase-related protein [Planktomarina temperata]
MDLSQKDIRFLNFGYFLENSSPVELKFTQNKDFLELNYVEALEMAGELWVSSFAAAYTSTESMEQVVPISGGIDSRALLMELLKYRAAKDIYTFTFGVPGSLDFDIGNAIARHYGTNHCQLPCDQNILSYSNASEFGRLVDYSCNLFLTPEVAHLRRYRDMNIWSGTVIDVFFGRHYHERTASSINAAAENFILENAQSRYFKQLIDKKALVEILDAPKLPGCSLEHTIDLANRQAKFVAKHLLYDGYNFSTMLNEDLMVFALSINQNFHSKQKLYTEMMQTLYPDFNIFPCKTSIGLKLTAPNYQVFAKRLNIKLLKMLSKSFTDPYVNYLDWEKEISETIVQRISRSIGYDELSDLTVKLLELNRNDGGYAMDILNILSLRIIKKHEKG